MYSILIATTVALLLGAGGTYLEWWGWGWGIFIGILGFFATSIFLSLRMRKQLMPAMERVQKQMQARMFDAAVQSLEGILPLGKWMPMLTGQIHSQIGTIHYMRGETEKAITHLSQSTKRSAEGQLFLACTLYRQGDKDNAIKTLALAAAVNKKHALLHNTRAWILAKEGRTDEAMAALAQYLKKEDNGTAKENLLRLQNGKKVSMKAFGDQWFVLQLEKPPAGMQMQQVRKGFRQPPKRRKS